MIYNDLIMITVLIVPFVQLLGHSGFEVRPIYSIFARSYSMKLLFSSKIYI